MTPPQGFVLFESLHPTPDASSPTLMADIAKVALAMGRLRPWMLVQLPGEPQYVAREHRWWHPRAWWMRLRVGLANRYRRRECERRKAMLAARWAELDRRRALGLPLNDGSST